MSPFAANVPDGYLIASLVAIFGFVAWLVREMGRISQDNTKSNTIIFYLEQKINEQEARMERHEAWIDALRHPSI